VNTKTAAEKSGVPTKPDRNARKNYKVPPYRAGKEQIMVRKEPYAPKSTAGFRLTHKERCWIKYQINLRNITYGTVASIAGISDKTVAGFINSCNNSLKTQAALCEILGYATFDDLRAAANGKGDAA
jgi:hypothetical protein